MLYSIGGAIKSIGISNVTFESLNAGLAQLGIEEYVSARAG